MKIYGKDAFYDMRFAVGDPVKKLAGMVTI
jgi:hypothetical protein